MNFLFSVLWKQWSSKRSELFKNLVVDFKIDWFVLTLKYSDPYKTIFKNFSSGQSVRDESTVYMSSRSSVLILEYSLQRKRKWSVVSVSTPHLHIGSTVSLKSCLNLCSLKWLKFNLTRVSLLRPLVSCIAKTEFSLGLMIVSLNLFPDTMFRISEIPEILGQFLGKDDYMMYL